jgi:hypothetical protein
MRADHSSDDDLDKYDDLDEESTGHLHRDIEEAGEEDKYPEGRPGSFLNYLIRAGNKKTEDDIATGGSRKSSKSSEGGSI